MAEISSRIILRSNDEVLMSKGDTGSIKFLGGRIRPGEEPLATAIREAREEGGVDLAPMNSSIVELPFQDSDPQRLSYWFGVSTLRFQDDELTCGDDVVALFWVALSMVENTLTYDNWKEHWIRLLLPALLAKT
ncbi:NUDIX hydrolase [Candidatus Woesebacteria bacterium]|nr:NUDIX hydrolase [Candidatus Woesebacteria bacterium]